MDEGRRRGIEDAIRRLDDDNDFTASGKPSVDALNRELEHWDVTASERDEVWKDMEHDRKANEADDGGDGGDGDAGVGDDMSPVERMAASVRGEGPGDAEGGADSRVVDPEASHEHGDGGGGQEELREAPSPEEMDTPQSIEPEKTTAGNPKTGETDLTAREAEREAETDEEKFSSQPLRTPPLTQAQEAQNPRTRQEDIQKAIHERGNHAGQQAGKHLKDEEDEE